ncbi:hypothetical protein BHAOGJBA_6009 [Methylobacterium hispanicum]|uniref:Lipoprotein n=1 Tax=Methylobacterium hispanicum TaxID=270350 RepID=A0AAV4ZX26_9HYPH|nr:hypothetical protein [Methylobacterium hispanicum]GJD92455.1 hypothetical protein BHAOGJBA_6009 [Methylobacterium hispanicum]
MRAVAARVSCAALFVLAGGCSVYPTTDQSTGFDTSRIIQKIRCQMGRAVRATAIEHIRQFGDRMVYPGKTGKQLAAEIEGGRPYDSYDRRLVIPEIRRNFTYYDTAKVGYDFSLDNKEQNKQSVGGVVTRRFLRRVDALGLFGENDLTRQVQRNFRILDEFRQLGSDAFAEECAPVLADLSINIEFPIAGRLPFENLVDSFVVANERQHLQGDEKTPAIPKMADTIMFTTKISLNVDPAAAYNPVGRGVLPSTLGFSFNNIRTDYHKVIVAIEVPQRKVLVDQAGIVRRLPLSDRDQVSRTLDEQRERNVQNAIVKIGDALSSGLPF